VAANLPLDVKEREQRVRDLSASLNELQQELAEREQTLERRLEKVSEREGALVARAAALAARAAAPPKAVELPPPPRPAPPQPLLPPPRPPVAVPWPAHVPAGAYNLADIEAAVDALPADDDRVEEWRYYVVYLREYASADGALPRSFDSLVYDVFGDDVRMHL
jgi:hypothetical protein